MPSQANYQPAIIRSFGGRRTFGERSECPPGMSPNCSDVAFGLDSVRSRVGLALRFTDQWGVNSMYSFYGQDRLRRLLVLKNNGDLLVEGPVVNQLPPSFNPTPLSTTEGVSLTLRTGIVPNAVMKATYAFNRAWMCFSDGKRPLDYPWQYDPSYVSPINDLYYGTTLPASPTEPYIGLATATPMAGGTMTAGTRYGFFTLEDRYGMRTGMSPVFKVTVTGGQKIRFGNIPLGPINDLFAANYTGATARVRFWFTAAEVAGAGAGPFYSPDTLVFGRGTTTIDITFTDTELITGELWAPFETMVNAPIATGVVSYANRLFYWGVYGGIPNILSHVITPGGVTGAAAAHLGPPPLDFSTMDALQAGTLADATWATTVAGTQTVAKVTNISGARSKIVVRLHGDGVNAGPTLKASFPAYRQTQEGTSLAWPTPGTRVGWIVRMRKKSAWTSGTLRISCSWIDALTYVLATRDFAPADVSTDWSLYFIDGSTDTPGDSTSATVIELTTTWTGVSPNGDLLEIDWFHPYNMTDKFQGATLWGSEFGQPEQFDLVKSPVPITPGDGQEVRCAFEQNGNLYVVKERSMWVTTDNGSDPEAWNVDMISPIVGTPSMNGVGLGPDFAIIASDDGVYYFDSGKLEKVSLEIQPDWDAIDWLQAHLIWVVVDPRLKQVRIGVPLSTNQGVCSQIFYLDYAEGWETGERSEGHGRKWSIDNVVTSCAEYGLRDDLRSEVLLGGRRASTNRIEAAQDFGSAQWIQTGLAPAIGNCASPRGDTTAAAVAWQWTYGGVGPCTAFLLRGGHNILNTETSIFSFYARTHPGSGNGDITISVQGAGHLPQTDVITSEWKRFKFVFQPIGGVGFSTEQWNLEFTPVNGTDHPNIDLYGPQSQVFTGEGYDQGFLPPGVASGESGFISRMGVNQGGTPGWAVSDWDQRIDPVYDTAPIGLDIVRSQYENVVVRARGAGGLFVSYVGPDGTPTALDGGTAKALASNPTEDVKLGGYAEGPYMGLRFAMRQLGAWFSLKRIGFFTKKHDSIETLDR